jgi:hypothetical protein
MPLQSSAIVSSSPSGARRRIRFGCQQEAHRPPSASNASPSGIAPSSARTGSGSPPASGSRVTPGQVDSATYSRPPRSIVARDRGAVAQLKRRIKRPCPCVGTLARTGLQLNARV